MRSSSVVLLLSSLSLSLVACGGDDDGGATPTVDAGGGTDAAATIDGPAPAACTISTENFGDKGALMGAAFFDPENGEDMTDTGATDDVLTFVSFLEAGMPSDVLQVDLYAGYGVFPGAITPGTYQLTGAELDFATCGACVRIFTDVMPDGMGTGIYMATGGTLTVTATGTAVGQTLTGSVSNLTFNHVNIDRDTGATTDAGDTCASALSNGTFTAMLQADS